MQDIVITKFTSEKKLNNKNSGFRKKTLITKVWYQIQVNLPDVLMHFYGKDRDFPSWHPLH